MLGVALWFGVLSAPRLGLAPGAYAMDVRAAGNPTRSSCSSGRKDGVLLEEVPSEATVLDVVWIGRTALDEELDFERVVRVQQGDTFLSLLGRHGIPQGEALDWYRSSREVFNLSHLEPGRDLTLSFDDHGELAGLEYEIDQVTVFLAERRASGDVVARKGEVPSLSEVRGVAGKIRSSITADSLAAGVPRRVVQQMASIFGNKLNFKHLRKGDAFRILYEVKVTEDGEELASRSQIIAAEVDTAGKAHTALRARGPDGAKTYVDLEGISLEPKRADRLGSPVDYTRISSRFSRSRLHPKTRRRRPHLGVDFAAPHGTPVRAVADGQVEFAKWHGGMGRTIRIDHGRALRYDSLYGHLTRFARGLRAGSRVRRGEVIGYVGSTGLATGPHLHFSLLEGKQYVDPLKELKEVRYRKPLRVSGDEFEKYKERMVSALDALDHDGPVRHTRLADAFDL